jgi:hypothetical protein
VFNGEIIYKSLPQYIWVIEYFKVKHVNNNHSAVHVFSLLIDVTSLSSLFNILDIVIFDNDFLLFIKDNKKNFEALKESFEQIIRNSPNISDEIVVARRQLYLIENFFLTTIEKF